MIRPDTGSRWNVSGSSTSLVGWRTLFDSLNNAAGKRLLVVDTCHARGAAGTFDARSLKKRSASSHFPLLLSSDSKELSQDYPKARHGLFTYALLRGLRGEADATQDGVVSLAELTAARKPYLPIVRTFVVLGDVVPSLRERLIQRIEAGLRSED